MKTIYLETLGCSKNQVDSEKMLYLLEEAGYLITDDPENAQIIIINTCGFIKSAKEEAIETILNLTEYKLDGQCEKIIVAGCLAQRYAEEIKKEIPEVDIVFGVGNISQVLEAVEGEKQTIIPDYQPDHLTKRKILGYPGTGYLRISDGCSNFCSYCSIPLIRGHLRSREIYEILEELQFMMSQDLSEIIIIAQDSANYGQDIHHKAMLGELISQIDAVLPDNIWLRVLYLHPEHLTDAILDHMKKARHFLPYFDLPFQSASDKILKSMGRKKAAHYYLNLIKKIRDKFENPVFRSSFIVGYPGETEGDFQQTLDFLNQAKLDWVGAFPYSKEENTQAAHLKKQVSKKVKEKRYNQLLDLTESITTQSLNRFIGTQQKVLIEEPVEGSDLYLGRFWGQAPEVDGLTVVDAFNAKPGTFIQTTIKKLNGKDFYAAE
ncbi:MAG: 30S ribosomal protein S12 methylthiotransferase RimO [Spirochaetes bacterium]|nr:30S ribosomal protein S12 methylthiotransferase RimO [Spirochaetota bacterium]